MKTNKKLKITTFIIILLTLFITFKIYSFCTPQTIIDLGYVFYDTNPEIDGYKLVENKIVVVYANNEIYNKNGVVKNSDSQKRIDRIDNNKCWSIKIYIDDNEIPYKEIIMTDEEFWSFDNAHYYIYTGGCINSDSIEIYNNEYEIYFNDVEINKSITVCYKSGDSIDGDNRNEIFRVYIPCHTKNNEVIIDGAKSYLEKEYV